MQLQIEGASAQTFLDSIGLGDEYDPSAVYYIDVSPAGNRKTVFKGDEPFAIASWDAEMETADLAHGRKYRGWRVCVAPNY